MLNFSAENVSGFVLIADDNAINRVLAKKLFLKWEINADFVENGQLAYEMVILKNYDLILMDMHMPVLDGLEATQKIRLLPENKYQTLPIIALTGSVFEMDLENLYQYGLTDYFLKPYTPEGLYNKIKPYLKATTKIAEAKK
ncbi:MAG: response regulator [Sphingobacteriaceae bacterium]|nr:MAG: response regulator [Sphingobacteriaceae bacterium]